MFEKSKFDDGYEIPMSKDYPEGNSEDYEVVDIEGRQAHLRGNIEKKTSQLQEMEQSLQELIERKKILEQTLKEDKAELAQLDE